MLKHIWLSKRTWTHTIFCCWGYSIRRYYGKMRLQFRWNPTCFVPIPAGIAQHLFPSRGNLANLASIPAVFSRNPSPSPWSLKLSSLHCNLPEKLAILVAQRLYYYTYCPILASKIYDDNVDGIGRFIKTSRILKKALHFDSDTTKSHFWCIIRSWQYLTQLSKLRYQRRKLGNARASHAKNAKSITDVYTSGTFNRTKSTITGNHATLRITFYTYEGTKCWPYVAENI